MTTSVDTSYGSWPATTPPFITKYGVVTNPSTSFSTGVVLDPYGAPPSLFINGEQGVWFDPSDRTTLFQDSAGTTPVTAVEQPVGLMLDKSKGLVLGTELVALLSGWSAQSGATISYTASELVVTANGTAFAGSTRTIPCVVGRTYRIKVSASANALAEWQFAISGIGASVIIIVAGGAVVNREIVFVATSTTHSFGPYCATGTSGAVLTTTAVSVKELPGNHATQATAGNRPTLSARYNILVGTAALATQSVTTLATNYTLSFTGAGTVTASGTNVGVYTAGTQTITCTAGSLTLTVAGAVTLADLRPVNDGVGLPAYQAVVDATNYDTVGFPKYLKANGTSSAMATGNIDFTATDKMTVIAGVRKLSDAALGMMFELSANLNTNNGSMYFTAPDGVSTSYGFKSKGTVASASVYNAAPATAPHTGVITATSNIVGDSVTLMANGVAATPSGLDQGTGNFGNYPLYLFARAGTSLFFNGRFYGAVIRGAQSTDAQIAMAETYMNTLTKAY